MKLYLEILAGVLPGLFVLVLILVLCRVCCRSRRQQITLHPTIDPAQNRDIEKALTRHTSRVASYALSSKSSVRFHQLYQDSIAPVEAQEIVAFSWIQHPELITEATENGWSRFAFNDMLHRTGSGSWEAPPGSSELMQAVRLNPSDSKGSNGSSSSNNNSDHSNLLSGVRMRLPLPGPVLNGFPFPQEAYYEVSIIYLKPHEEHKHKWYARASKKAKEPVEGDRSRLIVSASNRVDDAIKAIREQVAEKRNEEEEEKEGKKKGHTYKHVVIAMGLSAEVRMIKPGLPGMYPGSIGFHSDGSVYLDGMKLAIESDKKAWADPERVIGCGYDPAKKRVFFTLDSRIIHTINCTSQTYASPLFPVLASNTDTMLLVNLGQARFQYKPANAKRTPNPCFLRTNSAESDTSNTGFGYDDDSGDLFSVGRVDSTWSRMNSIKRSGPLFVDGVSTPTNFDHDDADFFEIPLKDC
ncbi:hypothetical protein LUZ61_000155 [Rhynchospora tenuis]|uniref:SPRY domain-containing protein n=1 Tax=Rhynchospora tenuis TaxID=198213 RepID=A0AAD5ZER0_9POAL|nr:hypothetical protein LUZ61_000155 [Rhynchospora tenuis]